jgi:hypothetical protein
MGMLDLATAGASAVLPDPSDVGDDVTRCMADLWPLLLAASNAADGPAPREAAPHLRAAAELLRRTATRIS